MCTCSLAYINYSIWLDASQRSWDGIWLNRSARDVKCKSALSSPKDWILRYIKTYLFYCKHHLKFSHYKTPQINVKWFQPVCGGTHSVLVLFLTMSFSSRYFQPHEKCLFDPDMCRKTHVREPLRGNWGDSLLIHWGGHKAGMYLLRRGAFIVSDVHRNAQDISRFSR